MGVVECKGDSMESLMKDNTLCFVDRQVSLKDKDVILHSLNLAYQDLFFQNGEYLIVGRVIKVLQEVE